jgi:hypothetical protein
MSRFSIATLGSGAALVALALVGCSDPSAPEGKRGALTVRAYIDRDASNTFTPADSALAGVAVSLTRAGAAVATQNTNATGQVTFEGLAPGSYQVSAPAATGRRRGAHVQPHALGRHRIPGRQRAVDFTYAFFPGVIAGTVYRDENANGTFEGTDTPGVGLRVYLRQDSAGAARRIVDSTTTGNDGSYRFGLVAPGSYYVEFVNPGTLDFGARAPRGASRSARRARRR